MFREHLPKIYRDDKWLNELDKTISNSFDLAGQLMGEIAEQQFSDTATWMIPIYENQLNVYGEGKPLDDRRALIQAYWKRGGRVGIKEIQSAADSWRGGAVECTFDVQKGAILLHFISEYGIPKDLDGFRRAIGSICPAHLSLDFIYKYLLIRDIHEVKTINEMNELTLDKFARGKER